MGSSTKTKKQIFYTNTIINVQQCGKTLKISNAQEMAPKSNKQTVPGNGPSSSKTNTTCYGSEPNN